MDFLLFMMTFLFVYASYRYKTDINELNKVIEKLKEKWEE